jgi:hypothetical protein
VAGKEERDSAAYISIEAKLAEAMTDSVWVHFRKILAL